MSFVLKILNYTNMHFISKRYVLISTLGVTGGGEGVYER
jgi:hypothetical protein